MTACLLENDNLQYMLHSYLAILGTQNVNDNLRVKYFENKLLSIHITKELSLNTLIAKGLVFQNWYKNSEVNQQLACHFQGRFTGTNWEWWVK